MEYCLEVRRVGEERFEVFSAEMFVSFGANLSLRTYDRLASSGKSCISWVVMLVSSSYSDNVEIACYFCTSSLFL